jgi:hypothetical protein
VLGIIGWLSCAVGGAMAVWIRPDAAARAVGAAGAAGAAGELSVAPRYEVRPVRWLAAVVVAGLGVAAAFAPSWDTYTLRTASGQSESLTAGNAFANAGAVIAGDVMVMIALVAVLVVAGLLRPVRQGGILLLGAIIPMVAQAISAIIQLLEPATPSQFGISPAQAALSNLTISSGATAAFWIYCIFIAAAVLIGVRMILPSRPAATAAVVPPWFPAAGAGPAGAPAFGMPAIAGVPAAPGAAVPEAALPPGAPGPAAPSAAGSPPAAPPPASLPPTAPPPTDAAG